MELVAVVCIETSHYVSFVRCGDSPRAPWGFFDSMADRQGKEQLTFSKCVLRVKNINYSGEQNGYNIPELTPAPDVERILTEAAAEQFRTNPNLQLPEHSKRLVTDAYMCFYQVRSCRENGGGGILCTYKLL